jgi:integrase/recombinase XerD
MLTIYRRHKKGCEHRSEGREYRRCRCPLHVEGLLGDGLVRQSLKTCDWERAQNIVREWEAEGRRVEQSQPVRIEEAAEKFLADAKARKLGEATVYKYDLLFRQLKDFAGRTGYELVRELDVDALTRFRSEWKDGSTAGGKKLGLLRCFLGFCQERHWIAENPAKKLKMPKVDPRPTMPFTHDELVRILEAVEAYSENAARNARLNAARIRALVLLLRYSGMRIGDAVSLTVDRIVGSRLFLYTAKTGTPVYVLLPDFVAETLKAAPMMTDRYYFWTGIGKLRTAVRVWETRLRRLFNLAKMPGGHAHRFRDTFTVELLLAGVPLERVSVLLGHQSIRVTEKHYAPWVRSRQEQLERDLESAWSRDPLVLLHTNHTRDTRGESERPN